MEENTVSVTPPEPSASGEDSLLGFSSTVEERIEAPESPRSQSLGAMAVIDLALTMAIMLVASVIFARTSNVAITELLALGIAGALTLSATLSGGAMPTSSTAQSSGTATFLSLSVRWWLSSLG